MIGVSAGGQGFPEKHVRVEAAVSTPTHQKQYGVSTRETIDASAQEIGGMEKI